MEWISVEDKDKLPDIDEPVLILFGEDYMPLYTRIETGRRVMTNSTDWTWYGFLNNTMHLDVIGWQKIDTRSNTIVCQRIDISDVYGLSA